MANVAHLVRASGCGSEGRGFDPLHSPQINKIAFRLSYLFGMYLRDRPSE